MNVKEIIEKSEELIQDDDLLRSDVKEEYENLMEYLEKGETKPIDETMKVFYRLLKWRLS